MTVMVLGVFLLLPFIMRAYGLSDMTADMAKKIVHFHGISAIIVWPAAFTLPSTFRASGDAKACMYISMLSMWIFRIVFSYILGKYMGMGVFGVWAAMVIDSVLRAACLIVRYFGGKRRKQALV